MPTIEAARAWYPGDDPVHGFDHVLRVLAVAERLAGLEGADPEIVRAAVLLHDAQDPAGPDGGEEEWREAHQLASAAFARRVLLAEGWDAARVAAVEHCIRSHRFRDGREAPGTREAQVVFDADKLDAIGAIGVARAVAYAARAGQPAYSRPSERFLDSGEKEEGEAHSAYHEYLFKLRKLKGRMFTESGKRLAEERDRFMGEFFGRLEEEVGGGLANL